MVAVGGTQEGGQRCQVDELSTARKISVNNLPFEFNSLVCVRVCACAEMPWHLQKPHR